MPQIPSIQKNNCTFEVKQNKSKKAARTTAKPLACIRKEISKERKMIIAGVFPNVMESKWINIKINIV